MIETVAVNGEVRRLEELGAVRRDPGGQGRAASLEVSAAGRELLAWAADRTGAGPATSVRQAQVNGQCTAYVRERFLAGGGYERTGRVEGCHRALEAGGRLFDGRAAKDVIVRNPRIHQRDGRRVTDADAHFLLKLHDAYPGRTRFDHKSPHPRPS